MTHHLCHQSGDFDSQKNRFETSDFDPVDVLLFDVLFLFFLELIEQNEIESEIENFEKLMFPTNESFPDGPRSV